MERKEKMRKFFLHVDGLLDLLMHILLIAAALKYLL